MRAWLAVVALLLAGCSGSPNPSDGPADPDSADPSAMEEEGPGPPADSRAEPQEKALSWDASTMGSVCVFTEPVREGCFGVHDFPPDASRDVDVPAKATGATFTFTWSATDLRTETLEMSVLRDGVAVQAETGTSPLELSLEDLSPGTVTLLAYPAGPAGLPARAHDAQPYHVDGSLLFLA